MLPAPAELVLERGAEPLAWQLELYARRAWGDVLAEDRQTLARRLRVDLPSGRWLLLWRRVDGGPLRSHVFEAVAGAQVRVDLR